MLRTGVQFISCAVNKPLLSRLVQREDGRLNLLNDVGVRLDVRSHLTLGGFQISQHLTELQR